jgi:hypothetical protein
MNKSELGWQRRALVLAVSGALGLLATDSFAAGVLSYSNTTFHEANGNLGAIGDTLTISLAGDTFTGSGSWLLGGDLVSQGKVFVGNLPPGLSAQVLRTSDTSLQLSLSGQAVSHTARDDINNLSVVFADSAFASANAGSVSGASRGDLAIEFYDVDTIAPVSAVLHGCAIFGCPILITDSSARMQVRMDEAGSEYYVVLPASVAVPSAAQVIAGQDALGATAAFKGNLAMSAYRDLTVEVAGLLPDTAYVAYFAAKDLAGNNESVAKTFAFQTYPRGLNYSTTLFTATGLTPGVIDAPIYITLHGDTLTGADGDDFVASGKVTVSNVPAGLTASFRRANSEGGILSLSGVATNPVSGTSVGNLSVHFADSAFSGGDASKLAYTHKTNLVIDFLDTDLGNGFNRSLYSKIGSPSVTSSSVSINTSLTDTGTGYYVVMPSGGGLGFASVIFAQDGYGAPAAIAGSAAMAAHSDHTFTVVGLAANAGYDFFFAAKNGANQAVSSVAIQSFTTSPLSQAFAAAIDIVAGSSLNIIPGSSGATINLPFVSNAVASDSDGINVAIGSNRMMVKATASGSVLKTMSVKFDGVDSTLLNAAAGTVRLSAGKAGQPLFAVGSSASATTLLADSAASDVVVQVNDRTGETSLGVNAGCVMLSPPGLALANGGRLYAGEAVVFDRAGNVASIRLGSLNGGAQQLGDPLATAVTAPGLTNLSVVPKLQGKVVRLAADSRDFTEVLASVLGSGVSSRGQNANGVLVLTVPSGTVNLLPLGNIVIDSSRADGARFASNGRLEVTRGGVTATFVPAVADPTQLAAQIVAQDRTGTLTIKEDGLLQATVDGTTYALQPSWVVEPVAGGRGGISINEAGLRQFQDAAGNRQTLFPVFADLPHVLDVLRKQDFNVTATANDNGTVTATFLGTTYTLLPDYVIGAVPAAHAGDAWWLDGGRFYMQSVDGKAAQGFRVQ